MCSSQIVLGKSMAVTMDPSETRREITTTTRKMITAASVARGLKRTNAPRAVATPLPPRVVGAGEGTGAAEDAGGGGGHGGGVGGADRIGDGIEGADLFHVEKKN